MSNLLIIRTPFQAWLAERVIESENLETFDLIYFTQNDSEEDIYYYQKLASKSNLSSYYFVKPTNPSILSSLLFKVKAKSWYKINDYDKILCASIDAIYITSLIRHYSNSKLITFDDGSANINTSSIYFKPDSNKRAVLYKYLFRSLDLKKVKSRIQRHYTMYQGMENIVEPNRLIYLNNIIEKPVAIDNQQEAKTYFISAPFEEVLSSEQIQRLTNTLNNYDIDVYVKHPRERSKIRIDKPFLDKKGRIAEEAIISDAQNNEIILIGWFSTVMLNIGDLCHKRIVLLAKDAANTSELAKLSETAGCEVVLF